MTPHDFEWYPTPAAATRWLFSTMALKGHRIHGVVYEPCVGDRAIVRASEGADDHAGISLERAWVTNDLDPRWPADRHVDAAHATSWRGIHCDAVVTNPSFSLAIEIATLAIESAPIVAMHLRASIHEPLKTGLRRFWMAKYPPTGILWLPRFAYQRSRAKGAWSTDSVTACWCVWVRDAKNQFIDYAPASVIDELTAETPVYRQRMDAAMGFVGTEANRQAQCREFWKAVAA